MICLLLIWVIVLILVVSLSLFKVVIGILFFDEFFVFFVWFWNVFVWGVWEINLLFLSLLSELNLLFVNWILMGVIVWLFWIYFVLMFFNVVKSWLVILFWLRLVGWLLGLCMISMRNGIDFFKLECVCVIFGIWFIINWILVFNFVNFVRFGFCIWILIGVLYGGFCLSWWMRIWFFLCIWLNLFCRLWVSDWVVVLLCRLIIVCV